MNNQSTIHNPDAAAANFSGSPTQQNTSSQEFLLETSADRARLELDGRIGIIRFVALLLTLTSVGSALMGVGIALVGIGQSWGAIVTIITSVAAALIYWFSRVAINVGSSNNQVNAATYAMLGSLMVAISANLLVTGVESGLLVAYLLIPLLGVITGLPFTRVVFTSVLVALSSALIFTLEKVTLIVAPPIGLRDYPVITMGVWLILFGVLTSGIVVFARFYTASKAKLEAQTEFRNQLLLTLNQAQQVGAELSRQLVMASVQLTSSSRQQATSSQEQVAAVTQVTSSLEELGETASSIATSSQGVSGAANKMVNIGEEVLSEAEQFSQIASEGKRAVSESLESVSRLRHRIELVGQRLLTLNEQAKHLVGIVKVIEEVAAETHLLALNASIEAAGKIILAEQTEAVEAALVDKVSVASAVDGGTLSKVGGRKGDNSDSRNRRGVIRQSERFGVVAQEIKNLADRVGEYTEEVRGSVAEMQGALATSILVAEEGKKSASLSLLLTQKAGIVIDQLEVKIADGVGRFEQVIAMNEEVRQKCDEISLATNQQRTANVQIVQTMRNISDISHEYAATATQTDQAASVITDGVQKLNSILSTITLTSSNV